MLLAALCSSGKVPLMQREKKKHWENLNIIRIIFHIIQNANDMHNTLVKQNVWSTQFSNRFEKSSKFYFDHWQIKRYDKNENWTIRCTCTPANARITKFKRKMTLFIMSLLFWCCYMKIYLITSMINFMFYAPVLIQIGCQSMGAVIWYFVAWAKTVIISKFILHFWIKFFISPTTHNLNKITTNNKLVFWNSVNKALYRYFLSVLRFAIADATLFRLLDDITLSIQ